IFVCAAFLVARSDEFGRFELILLALLLIFIASQIFWIGRLVDVEQRFVPGRPRRLRLAIVSVVFYLFVLLYSYPEWGQGHVIRAADYRPLSVVIHAAFWWWFVGSMSAFLLVIVFGVANWVARATGWVYRKARTARQPHAKAVDASALLSPGRRRFLERTAVLVSATPFVATGYGLLYGRQDVGIEDSITRFFAARGIRMLRQERAPIRRGDEKLNLIGIDHGSDVAPDAEQQVEGDRRLQQLKALIVPDTVNILLTHYPHFFDHHSELGIDLTLAGDIHGGGQLSLDFIHRGLNLGTLMGVPYIRGLYENG